MKKNLLIAFSGMDGSGKTTVAKKLESYMNKKGYNVFFKHAHGYAISKNSFSVDEKSIKRFRWLLFLLSPFMLLDSYFTYYFKYKPQLKHNTVICDRYFYDKVARMLYYNIINKFVARIYLSLLPQPDHLFFLNVSSHNAKLRKNEYSNNEYNRFREVYQFIAMKTNAIVIDADLPLNTVFNKTISYI